MQQGLTTEDTDCPHAGAYIILMIHGEIPWLFPLLLSGPVNLLMNLPQETLCLQTEAGKHEDVSPNDAVQDAVQQAGQDHSHVTIMPKRSLLPDCTMRTEHSLKVVTDQAASPCSKDTVKCI